MRSATAPLRFVTLRPAYNSRMTRPLLLALGLALASAGAGAQTPDVALEPLTSILVKRLADSDSPACIAVAVLRDKPTVSFGCSADAGPVMPDRDSIFEIGSITKGLTGLLLADMVRTGELELADPAAKYSRPGAKLPTRGGRQVTLRDLVTHTAGLPRMPPGFHAHDWQNPFARFDVDALYDSLARTTLVRDIGLSSEYSNFGFMWLSEILARRGGKPFDQLLAERVLRPIGMASAAIEVPHAHAARRVTGHDSAYRPVPRWDNHIELSGVGGLKASLEDMVRLAEALAGVRATPLDATIALALKPLHRLGDAQSHVAYGWFVGDGGRVWHSGGTGGFRAIIDVNRAARTYAVVLSDSTEGFTDLAHHLMDPAWPLKWKAASVPIGAEDLRELEGEYALAPDFVITVFTRFGRLFGQATRQQPIEMRFLGKDRFAAVGVHADLQFARASDGSVESLTLIQDGKQTTGRRAK